MRPGRGFGPGFGRREAGKPGPKVAPTEVKTYPPETKLYDPTALRKLFFEFENTDWEAELADFHNTDDEVPATMVVDGNEPGAGRRTQLSLRTFADARRAYLLTATETK